MAGNLQNVSASWNRPIWARQGIRQTLYEATSYLYISLSLKDIDQQWIYSRQRRLWVLCQSGKHGASFKWILWDLCSNWWPCRWFLVLKTYLLPFLFSKDFPSPLRKTAKLWNVCQLRNKRIGNHDWHLMLMCFVEVCRRKDVEVQVVALDAFLLVKSLLVRGTCTYQCYWWVGLGRDSFVSFSSDGEKQNQEQWLQ